MTKKTVVLVSHLPKETGGILLPLLAERGFAIHIVKLYKGELIPPPNEYDALISLGGLMSARSQSPAILHELYSIEEVLKLNKPYLGICLGLQTLARVAGGRIVRSQRKEIGFRQDHTDPQSQRLQLRLTPFGRQDPLFKNMTSDIVESVFQLHRATVVFDAPTIYPVTVLATDRDSIVPHQVIRVGQSAYGIQSHRELNHEALLLWINQYASMGQLSIKDKWQMIREYDQVEPEYTHMSTHIFNNFLDIIESSTPYSSIHTMLYPERSI